MPSPPAPHKLLRLFLNFNPDFSDWVAGKKKMKKISPRSKSRSGWQ
jgi:hypothetical protein